jgi:hypothetical protein
MSDRPRDWPNVAKQARDRAAEEAQAGITALTPLLTEDRIFTERETLLRISRAIVHLQQIARHLEAVGAPTRPQ